MNNEGLNYFFSLNNAKTSNTIPNNFASNIFDANQYKNDSYLNSNKEVISNGKSILFNTSITPILYENIQKSNEKKVNFSASNKAFSKETPIRNPKCHLNSSNVYNIYNTTNNNINNTIINNKNVNYNINSNIYNCNNNNNNSCKMNNQDNENITMYKLINSKINNDNFYINNKLFNDNTEFPFQESMTNNNNNNKGYKTNPLADKNIHINTANKVNNTLNVNSLNSINNINSVHHSIYNNINDKNLEYRSPKFFIENKNYKYKIDENSDKYKYSYFNNNNSLFKKNDLNSVNNNNIKNYNNVKSNNINYNEFICNNCNINHPIGTSNNCINIIKSQPEIIGSSYESNSLRISDEINEDTQSSNLLINERINNDIRTNNYINNEETNNEATYLLKNKEYFILLLNKFYHLNNKNIIQLSYSKDGSQLIQILTTMIINTFELVKNNPSSSSINSQFLLLSDILVKYSDKIKTVLVKFKEILPSLMTNSFSSYAFQKILPLTNSQQRLDIWKMNIKYLEILATNKIANLCLKDLIKNITNKQEEDFVINLFFKEDSNQEALYLRICNKEFGYCVILSLLDFLSISNNYYQDLNKNSNLIESNKNKTNSNSSNNNNNNNNNSSTNINSNSSDSSKKNKKNIHIIIKKYIEPNNIIFVLRKLISNTDSLIINKFGVYIFNHIVKILQNKISRDDSTSNKDKTLTLLNQSFLEIKLFLLETVLKGLNVSAKSKFGYYGIITLLSTFDFDTCIDILEYLLKNIESLFLCSFSFKLIRKIFSLYDDVSTLLFYKFNYFFIPFTTA